LRVARITSQHFAKQFERIVVLMSRNKQSPPRDTRERGLRIDAEILTKEHIRARQIAHGPDGLRAQYIVTAIDEDLRVAVLRRLIASSRGVALRGGGSERLLIRERPEILEMLARANQLAVAPEFYNSLTNNCTSNIVAHVNTLAPHRIPFSYKTIFPAYSDQLAYELGLIPTDEAFDKVRAAHRIDQVAQRDQAGRDFSTIIRAGIGK